MSAPELTRSVARSERSERVRMLVKQTLWNQPLHPACTAFQPEELFDTLMAHREKEKAKAHVLHNQEGDLHIFHYGQMVQNQACWTPELLLARGIVLRKGRDGCHVVATPWPKFFNLGEDGIGLEDLEAAVVGGRVEATSKMDGSLGLLFYHDGEWRVTTKGSFTSSQGRWATTWLNKHVDQTALTVGITYLVEIIYPENRIVIPYTFSTLVLLSAFDAAGRELERPELEQVAAASRLEAPEPEPELNLANDVLKSNDERYGVIGSSGSGFSLPALHRASNLEALMKAVNSWPGSEREGVVVRFIFPSGASHRVKIKGASYSAMHRNKDGISKKKIHEAARKGQANLEELRNTVAEELLPEFDAAIDEIDQACVAALQNVAEQWELAKQTLFADQHSIGWTKNARKVLSQWTQQHSTWGDGTAISDAFRACMFSHYMPHMQSVGDATVGIPTESRAWYQLDHPDRGTLLRYVLPLIIGRDSALQQEVQAVGKEDATSENSCKSVAAKAAKKRAKRARQKAKKKAEAAAA